jgi:spermidine/putrescine-binding protein
MKNTFAAILLFAGYFYANAQNDTVALGSDEKKIVLSVNGGYAYRLAAIADGIDGAAEQHMKNLKSGYSYQANLYYMFNKQTGVGIEYSAFKASETLPGQYEATGPNGQTGITTISDDITISYYGAGFIHNLLQEDEHKVYINASLGYMHYNNDAHIVGNYKITGGNLGMAVGIAYQYMAAKGFSVGPRLGFAAATLTKVTYEGPNGYNEEITLEDNNKESLLRLDLGVQAMYRF